MPEPDKNFDMDAFGSPGGFGYGALHERYGDDDFIYRADSEEDDSELDDIDIGEAERKGGANKPDAVDRTGKPDKSSKTDKAGSSNNPRAQKDKEKEKENKTSGQDYGEYGEPDGEPDYGESDFTPDWGDIFTDGPADDEPDNSGKSGSSSRSSGDDDEFDDIVLDDIALPAPAPVPRKDVAKEPDKSPDKKPDKMPDKTSDRKPGKNKENSPESESRSDSDSDSDRIRRPDKADRPAKPDKTDSKPVSKPAKPDRANNPDKPVKPTAQARLDKTDRKDRKEKKRADGERNPDTIKDAQGGGQPRRMTQRRKEKEQDMDNRQRASQIAAHKDTGHMRPERTVLFSKKRTDRQPSGRKGFLGIFGRKKEHDINPAGNMIPSGQTISGPASSEQSPRQPYIPQDHKRPQPKKSAREEIKKIKERADTPLTAKDLIEVAISDNVANGLDEAVDGKMNEAKEDLAASVREMKADSLDIQGTEPVSTEDKDNDNSDETNTNANANTENADTGADNDNDNGNDSSNNSPSTQEAEEKEKREPVRASWIEEGYEGRMSAGNIPSSSESSDVYKNGVKDSSGNLPSWICRD